MPEIKAAIIPVTPFQQNCTLIWDDTTRDAALIDPGGDAETIRQAIEEFGVKVGQILITHGHIDHVGAAMAMKDHLGVDIVGPHRDDKFLLDHTEEQGRGYGITEARNVVPDRWLEEGDSVDVGGIALEVLHCPGHAPGHVVFVEREANFAIVGDVLFNGSVGRTDLPGGDHDTLISSIVNKLLPLGDEMAFICGHGPGSTIGTERASNPFLVGAAQPAAK